MENVFVIWNDIKSNHKISNFIHKTALRQWPPHLIHHASTDPPQMASGST